MSSTEAPYVVSANFCAVRGETVDELYERLVAFNDHPEVEDQIAAFRGRVAGNAHSAAVQTAVASLGATVIASETTGPEVETDKWGSKYTYNHPDAKPLPDGRGDYILKEWTSKPKDDGSPGKELKAWVDPIKGPRPSRKGDAEAPIIWA